MNGDTLSIATEVNNVQEPTPKTSLPKHTHKRQQHEKIAIVGGGNLNCASFMASIVTHPEVLAGQHIVLMDINETNLELMYTLSQKAFLHSDVDITLERTTNLEEAVDDASFVLTTFRTGGLKARVLDEKIPLQHGLIGQDTIGPGGFFYALRTAPVLAGIAAVVEKVAPKAFLLNYSNPGNVVMEAIAHSSGVRIIGLNDSLTRGLQQIMQVANLHLEEIERLYPRTVGLNHGHWTTEIWHDGENILPQIIARCEEYIEHKGPMTAENYELQMLATLTVDFKAIPSYYMHYYYFPEIVLAFQRQKKTTPAEDLVAHIPHIIAQYREAIAQQPLRLQTLQQDQTLGDITLGVIDSILHDRGDEWVVSVPNNGAINFIANDRVVELPCSVDARGATPLTLGDGGLSIEQRGLISLLAEYEGATALASLWGKRRDAIKALAMNPLVMSYSKAEQVYDDLATAHAQYLPERLLA